MHLFCIFSKQHIIASIKHYCYWSAVVFSWGRPYIHHILLGKMQVLAIRQTEVDNHHQLHKVKWVLLLKFQCKAFQMHSLQFSLFDYPQIMMEDVVISHTGEIYPFQNSCLGCRSCCRRIRKDSKLHPHLEPLSCFSHQQGAWLCLCDRASQKKRLHLHSPSPPLLPFQCR